MGVRVAVTGGFASGKSSLCRFLQDLGATVVSADQIVHELLLNDSHVQQAIVQLFGTSVLKHGILSRESLANVVFEDLKKLSALEALLFPLVEEKIDRLYEEAGKNPLFVAEVPLLFEAGMENKFDVTVAVLAVEGLVPSFGDKRSFKQRVARQLAPKEKAKRSSIIVLNKSSLSDLRKEAHLLFKILLEPYHL